MRFGTFKFGSIQIDGTTYGHDVVIEGGTIRKRKKKPSKSFRSSFGHTPLSNSEDIPWTCRRLVVGTGANGALPIMEDVKRAAEARHVELLVLPTAQAIEELARGSTDMNAILQRDVLTCVLTTSARKNLLRGSGRGAAWPRQPGRNRTRSSW